MVDKKKIKAVFKKNRTRYTYWQSQLKYKALQAPLDRYLNYISECVTKLQANWIWSYCYNGSGFNNSGNWNTGNYSVSINCHDENMVKMEVVISDE